MKGPFQFGFSFPSSSNEEISSPESPWFDEILSLKRGSVMVLDHSNDCSLSFLLKLVQSPRELGDVSSAKGFEPGFNKNQHLGPKHEGVRGFPNRLFWSYTVDPECYR